MVSVAHAVRAVLRRYGASLLGEPQPVADSVINQNYRAETPAGPLFVKRHTAKRTRERIELEQAAISWAHDAGLPVARPLETPGGSTLVDLEGSTWSVYPWVAGSTLRRGSITLEGAALLGRTHGRLVRELARYPIEGLRPNSELSWETASSLRALAEVEPHVLASGTEQERRWLRRQQQLLGSTLARPGSDFAALPIQATHGDFHERNIMLDASGAVVAIVDWERFCVQPPAFEVLRAVSFMLLLEEPLLAAYLQGFRGETSLAKDTVAPAVEAWWQSQMHNTWAFRDSFLSGNAAARQFLPEEEARSAQFCDPTFRAWLAEMLIRHAS